MQFHLQNKRCAYCVGDTGKAFFVLDGHPACRTCLTQFGADADPDRLVRVRAYRAERRGLVHRLQTLTR